MNERLSRFFWLSILLMASAPVSGGPVGPLTTFSPNTTAKAAEVNGNFNAVKSAVDDNDSRITALQTALATAQNQIAALQALFAGVTRETLNGQPTVRFSGVNVQVVSGAGATNATPNGKGNLIIGYDEVRTDGRYICSIGTESNGAPIPPSNDPTPPGACVATGGTWAISHKSGSHYLVVGDRNNYSQYIGVVVGVLNTSNNVFASVSGGVGNTASGPAASVSGGAENNATGEAASVSGGVANTATGVAASVSGGSTNVAGGDYASVSGGNGNAASGVRASVSGGVANTASGVVASVSGGSNNIAVGTAASLSGGSGRVAAGPDDWVAGTLFQDF